MIRKTEKEILDEFYFEFKKIETLYQANCVNNVGRTKSGKIFYTEIIAEELLKNLNEFEKIQSIKREESYCIKNHCQIKINYCNSNRDEENFAKRITGLSFSQIGKILDYQIPLKNTNRENKNTGKVDLISYHKKKKTLFLLELKYDYSSDSLLKAVLEIYTYYKIVSKDKLIKDCKADKNIESKPNVKPAVLLTARCNAYSELQELLAGKRPMLKKLISKFGIKIFTLDFTDRLF